MKTIDLSHKIAPGMQIYPGDPAPDILKGLTYEDDYCHVDRLLLGSHTGTHIDAPYHFIKEGKGISDFDTDFFVGTGALCDMRGKGENQSITREDLMPYREKLKFADFAILMTGWDRYFGDPIYERHPFLSKEGAEFLVEMDVRIVGLDGLNIDSTVSEEFDSHEVLLSRDILIVENLCNLDSIKEGENGIYTFLPLKLNKTDGSPVRAVYILGDK